MDPRALAELFPDWKERGAPLRQAVAEDEFPVPRRNRRQGHAALAAAGLLQERQQLHRQPGRGDALAGATGRSAGRGDLPGRRRRSAVRRDRRGQGRPPATWASAGRPADRPVPARHGTAREVHDLRRGFARPARPATHREVPARCRQGSAELRHRHHELWQADPARHQPGLVVHTAGWPLDSDTYGGSFSTTPRAGRSRSASWSAWTTRIRG